MSLSCYDLAPPTAVPKRSNMGLAYNIFRKTTETLLVWVEAPVNLDEAKKRLISLASTEPDDYLIWDPTDHRFIEPLRKSA